MIVNKKLLKKSKAEVMGAAFQNKIITFKVREEIFSIFYLERRSKCYFIRERIYGINGKKSSWRRID